MTTVPGDDSSRILAYARRAVERAVREGSPDPAPPRDGPFAAPASVFVTLKRRRTGDLRGCIGHLLPGRALGENLASAARAAALEDPRFPPVAEAELPDLAVEVSVLGPFVPTADPLADLRIGVHGLRIREGDRAGLLLPQVAPEHHLDAPGFLDALCRKAGLPPGAWRSPTALVETFTAQVLGPD